MNAPAPLEDLDRAELETLVATSRQLAAELGLAELLNLIQRVACDLTGSPDSSVWLHDRERDVLYVAAALGDSADELLESFGVGAAERVPRDESKAGQVFTTGESIIVQAGDLDEDEQHHKRTDRRTGHTTVSMVCVPLEVAGRRLGAMQVLNKPSAPYQPRDKRLLETLATQAAVAIRNAQLVDDLLAHMGFGRPGGQSDPLATIAEINAPPRTELLTVMFADMRSFTTLANLLTPTELQERLNEYLTLLCDEVLLHDGIVNKLVGDGVVALFRGGDHARRAVECALSMTDRFDRMRSRWHSTSNFPLDFVDIGIGIATDVVTLATLGSRQVRDFTPIGTAVNVANALEFAARGGRRILCDQRTYGSVTDLVEEVSAPETFQLTKPGQDVSHPYKRFELRRRVAAAAEAGPVFLSYNRDDEQIVKEVAAALKQRGVSYWLDEEQLPPGRFFQVGLEEHIADTASCAAVFVGPTGLGQWEAVELRLALSQFVERQMPVIPVLLPGLGDHTELPPLLRELTWVDLREGLSDAGLDRLVWGIRGEKPGAEAPAS